MNGCSHFEQQPENKIPAVSGTEGNKTNRADVVNHSIILVSWFSVNDVLESICKSFPLFFFYLPIMFGISGTSRLYIVSTYTVTACRCQDRVLGLQSFPFSISGFNLIRG